MPSAVKPRLALTSQTLREAHRRLAAVLFVGSLLLSIAPLGGCRCGCDSDAIATVVTLTPITEVSISQAEWRAARRGSALNMGDALRTGQQGTAEVDIRDYGRLEVAPESLIRITSLTAQEDGPDELELEIENGSLEVSSSPGDQNPVLVIDSPTARLRLQSGSTANISVSEDDGVRLGLLIGRAEVENPDGDIEVIEGQTLQLSLDDDGHLSAVVLEPGEAGSGGGDEQQSSPGDGSGGAAGDAGVAAFDVAGDADAVIDPITVQRSGDARLELRGGDDEGWTPVKGAGVQADGATPFRVAGAGSVRILGPAGSSVELFGGSGGVILQNGGNQIRLRLAKGRGRARASGAGRAILTVPGGMVGTESLGGAAEFAAAIVDRRSSRIHVTEGAAQVTTAEGARRLLTGNVALLNAGEGPTITPGRVLQPSLASGSGIIYDAQKLGSFTLRWPPIDDASSIG